MRQPLAQRLLLGGVLCLHLTAAGAAPEEPEAAGVEVLPLRGASLRGTLEALTSAVLRLAVPGAQAPRELALAELREVRVPPSASPAPARDRLRVTLVNGDVLLAESYAAAPDGLEVRSASFGVLALSFEVLRSLEPLAARAGPCHDPAGRLPAQSGSDRLALVSGDELAGTLLEARADGLSIELERGRERVVPWADLLVAQFDNPVVPPTGAFTEVETQAGDLLHSAAAPTGEAATGLSVTLACDPALVALVPFGAVRALRWRGGACVDATLLPFSSSYTPLLATPAGSLTAEFLARERGARVGRRPRGCPLRLDGTVYAHGFAVHSGSTITLPLVGGFTTFEALVGIDDEAEELGKGRVPVPGDVDVRVLGDGRVLWEAKGVAGLEAARRVGPLDVSGVKELVLAVDYGGHDETLDRVTWADPVLLR